MNDLYLILETVLRQPSVCLFLCVSIEALPVANVIRIILAVVSFVTNANTVLFKSLMNLCLSVCSWPACRISSGTMMFSWLVGRRSFAMLRTTLCSHTAAKRRLSLTVRCTHTHKDQVQFKQFYSCSQRVNIKSWCKVCWLKLFLHRSLFLSRVQSQGIISCCSHSQNSQDSQRLLLL